MDPERVVEMQKNLPDEVRWYPVSHGMVDVSYWMLLGDVGI
jgi:hypothetical protein